MIRLSHLRVLTLVCGLFSGTAAGQEMGAPAQPSTDTVAPGQSQDQSLADIARKLRKNQTAEVRMSAEDAKSVFSEVDKISNFVAADTGFPKRSAVKRQLVGQADVEKYTHEKIAKVELSQRFVHSEMSMKKFGYLPRDFNLRDFIVKSNGQQVAGYYDDETKTISLLNWVPLDRQRPVLAHELTHALQDQNYNLQVWAKAGQKDSPDDKDPKSWSALDESVAARHAVIEGQAMVVYMDYLLAPLGRNLQNTPGLIYQMEEPAVKAVIDSEMLHNAPMILREAGTFPYREGLIFEGELLAKGGRQMAFAGAFARPPRNTHEVLQPRSYIAREELAAIAMPNVQQLLSGKYEIYDSGNVGELDVRAFVRQFGRRTVAEDISASWRGGVYSVFRKTSSAASADLTTADLALLYASRWKSPQAAQRFAEFYTGAVSQRYKKVTAQPLDPCSGPQCPVSAAQITTEEGLILIEQWSDNMVLVSESFDKATAAKLRDALRGGSGDVHARSLPSDELSLRLYELPAFWTFQENIGARIRREMEKGTP